MLKHSSSGFAVVNTAKPHMSVNLNTLLAKNGFPVPDQHIPHFDILPIVAALQSEFNVRPKQQTSKIFDFIPGDLTGVNLAPVYDLFREYDHTHNLRYELRVLENKWEPKTFSLTYNGPFSEDGGATRVNVRKWERFMISVYDGAALRFEDGDMPEQLKDAVLGLMQIGRTTSRDMYADCASSVDIDAMRAGLKMAFNALSSISMIVEELATDKAQYLRDELYSIESGKSEGVYPQ